jgi:hypothetical protein
MQKNVHMKKYLTSIYKLSKHLLNAFLNLKTIVNIFTSCYQAD